MPTGAKRLAHVLITAACLAAFGCASRKPPVAINDAPELQRLAAADALVRTGCLDCLRQAFTEYEALRASPRRRAMATLGAVRTATLVALRQRELGMVDAGYLDRARALLPQISDATSAAWLATLVDDADLQIDRTAFERRDTDERNVARGRQAFDRRQTLLDDLRGHADEDALSAYLWMSVSCVYGNGARAQRAAAGLESLPSWRDSGLITFRAATCVEVDEAALEALFKVDPRFVELDYFLGVLTMRVGNVDAAIARLTRAHEWYAQWPSLTNALGDAYSLVEEYEGSAAAFAETLVARPADPEALLGQSTALNNLGQYVESIASADRLLAGGVWYIGDARYLRALNEFELDRIPEAWTDIELAASMRVDAAVLKLAGLIAYKQRHLDIARVKFQEAWSRAPHDCQAAFYLGIVFGELSDWAKAVDTLTPAVACLSQEQISLRALIALIRASDNPPERKARKVSAREQHLAANDRMLANSWFNMAVDCFNLSRKDEARGFAERVQDDVDVGARAKELLTRLP